MKKLKITSTSISKFKNQFLFGFDFTPVHIKHKQDDYAVVERPPSLEIFFAIWGIYIYFSTDYWEDYCDKINIKNGFDSCTLRKSRHWRKS